MSTYYTPATVLSGLNLDNSNRKWVLLINVYLMSVALFLDRVGIY